MLASLRNLVVRSPKLHGSISSLRQVPAFRSLVDRLNILSQHGSCWPQKYTTRYGTDLYVDAKEARACRLLRNASAPSLPHRELWHVAIEQLQPTVVLDVGLNYGEFLLGETYPAGTRLIGIEANPRLQPWISKTCAAHKNRAQLEIHYALASDTADSEQPLYLNSSSSGLSSAVVATGESINVPTLTIDSLFKDTAATDGLLLFKIDVEGYEPVVLRGMEQTLDKFQASVGIIEFASRHAKQAGISFDEYFAYLGRRFQLHIFHKDGQILPVTTPDYATIQSQCTPTNGEIEIDLLLTTDDKIAAKLVQASRSNCLPT